MHIYFCAALQLWLLKQRTRGACTFCSKQVWLSSWEKYLNEISSPVWRFVGNNGGKYIDVVRFYFSFQDSWLRLLDAFWLFTADGTRIYPRHRYLQLDGCEGLTPVCQSHPVEEKPSILALALFLTAQFSFKCGKHIINSVSDFSILDSAFSNSWLTDINGKKAVLQVFD